MTLRHQHPNFWLVVIGDIVAMTWLGIAYTLADNTSPSWRIIEDVAPLRAWGVVYLLLATGLLYGVLRSPALFRAALALGAATLTLFSVGLALAIAQDLIERGDTPGAGGPAVYLFFAVCLVAQSREPRSNPDARRAAGR